MGEVNYYKYWGKADKDGNYHLLPYHCLDSAAVGNILIGHFISRKKQNIKNQIVLHKILVKCCLLFTALHDIGKFSISFQNLRNDLLEKLQGKISKKPYSTRHDQLGWNVYDDIIREYLLKQLNINSSTVSSIFDIFAEFSFGHHGIPPKNNMQSVRFTFNDDDLKALRQFTDELLVLFFPEGSKLFKPSIVVDKAELKNIKTYLNMISWELAGIMVVSDWIASGDYFTHNKDEYPLSDYWNKIHETALYAVNKAGILPSRPSKENGLSHIFPRFAARPTPLQKYCDKSEIKNKTQLWILEDVTGSGKTEASLILASRLISSGISDGCFIALPTMATSNAMYDRMGNVYYRLFSKNEKPSLILSHGSRHFIQKFRESYRDHIIVDVSKKHEKYTVNDDSRIHCSEWLADSSKKSLLADTGVGTIDQVLLGVLPVRYQSLRYYGMSRKVLIIDEVHSYDAYMLRILENVLTGHAASGGSAVLLSATLPKTVRERLIKAYKTGLGQDDSFELHDMGYPLSTTVIKGEKIIEKVIKTRPDVERSVKISFIEDDKEIYTLIRETIKKGYCICWIRNTVNDVLGAYENLLEISESSYSSIDVFHSRFALNDRIKIEESIIHNFGEKSGNEERKGRILLATQVVEQSLDLDFDILISDLAPIDLLIQRVGRMHRHLRDKQGNRIEDNVKSDRDAPVFYIHTPPDTKSPDAQWYSNYFRGASYVYRDSALLWRTKETLKHEGKITMPQRARFLIESVYGDNAVDVPEVFMHSEDNAWAEQLSKKDMAEFNVLKLFNGYNRQSSQRWDEEERVPTRLGDKQKTVYLCKYLNEKIVPLYKTEFPWDLSSLKVRNNSIGEIYYDNDLNEKIEEVKELKRLDKDSVFLLMNEEKSKGIDSKGNEITIYYDKKMGLRINKEV